MRDGADAVDDRAFTDGRVLGGDQYGPVPDACVIVLGEFQLGCCLADRVGGVLAGLRRLIVDDRLDLDEGALVGVGERLRAHQLAPGKRRIVLGEHLLDRLPDIGEGPRRIVEIGLPALDAGQSRLQRAG